MCAATAARAGGPKGLPLGLSSWLSEGPFGEHLPVRLVELAGLSEDLHPREADPGRDPGVAKDPLPPRLIEQAVAR
eukprot:12227087-Alexandrium_andersonii.AAC.1